MIYADVDGKKRSYYTLKSPVADLLLLCVDGRSVGYVRKVRMPGKNATRWRIYDSQRQVLGDDFHSIPDALRAVGKELGL